MTGDKGRRSERGGTFGRSGTEGDVRGRVSNYKGRPGVDFQYSRFSTLPLEYMISMPGKQKQSLVGVGDRVAGGG